MASRDSLRTAPDDLVELGRVASAYGIRGWIKVQPYSSDAEALLSAGQWWLKPFSPAEGRPAAPQARAYSVLACRPQGAAIVAQLDGVPDRNLAESLKGQTVWVSRSQFPVAEEDEYYWVDLVGCRLYGNDHGTDVLLGEVVGVLDNGAHGVLRVARATEQDDGGLAFKLDDKGRQLEVLVPFVAAHVHTVDLPNKRLLSDWPLDF